MAKVRHIGLFPAPGVADISTIPLQFPNGIAEGIYHRMTAEQAMWMFWKVKSWTVDYKIEVQTDSGVVVTEKKGISMFRADDQMVPQIITEKHLVCAAPVFLSDDPIFGGSEMTLRFAYDDDGSDVGPDIRPVKRTGSTYLPMIIARNGDNDYYSYPDARVHNSPKVNGATTFDLKYPGMQKIEVGAYVGTAEPEKVTVNVDFKADEIWTYD